MDVGEVVRRIGLAYWPLILGLPFAGFAGAAALHYNDAPIYTSDVRLVLDASDPRAASESVAIADTAKSIATTPSNVSDALASAGVSRDVKQFATRNIELQPLGTSGVMDLQVKDTDPVAAAAIATALSVSAAALSGLYSERTSLAQDRLTLEAQINQIKQSLALRPQAGVIDGAEPASKPDPSRAPIDMALGGLGGLVLGIILAALLATLRPRIRGSREISRMLEAPVLGDFQALEQEDHKSLPARVRIAAIRAGVKHVQLVPLDGSAEAVSLVKVMAKKLAPRAATVGTPLNGNGQVVAANRRKVHHSIDVTAFDVSLFSKNGDSAETGLILVTPNVLGRKDLDASAELL